MRYIFTLLLALGVLGAKAQTDSINVDRYLEYQEYQIIKNYSDSLLACRLKLDSLQRVNDSLAVAYNNILDDGRFYRLFAPLTFYHSSANKALRLSSVLRGQDAVADAVDNSLLNVYLNRPDLVRNTESKLRKVGTVNDEVSKPVQQTVSLVTQSAPGGDDDPVADNVDVVVSKPNFWTIKGDYYLQFLQNYISSNWYKGGESNYSFLASAVLEANYNNKQKVKWDNKLETKLGFQTSKSDSVHSFKTTEDLIRLTSKFGLQAANRWYYTLQLLAYTQFTKGYKSNDKFIYSDIMSPFVLNLSLGMDYNVEAFKKKLKGTVHLAPFAYNFKYVDRLLLSTRNGLDEGDHVKHDFGSQFTVDLKWTFSDNIQWQTRLYGFTTYERAEMEWENTFTFKFNKYISTKLFIYPRFDDNTYRDDDHGYWQFKEFFSLGFNYTF